MKNKWTIPVQQVLPILTFFLIGLLASSLATNVFSGTISDEQGKDFHLGEDGLLYPIHGDDKAAWRLGKIEPALETEALSRDYIDVIIFLDNSGLGAIAERIKAKYLSQIEGLSREIQALEGLYKPLNSIKEGEERQTITEIEDFVSVQDRIRLNNLRRDLDGLIDDMRQQIGTALKKAVSAAQKQLSDIIKENGGEISGRTLALSTITATIPSHVLDILAQSPLVVSIHRNRSTEYELDVSMPACSFNTWWNDNIDGGFFDFGIVDTGVQQDHPAFSGISFYTDSGGSSDTSDNGHGTHVAGIVASGNPTYTGGAFGLESIIWSSSSGGQGAVIDHMEWQATTPSQNPEVINHSLGYGRADDTDYSDTDAFYDAFVYNYDIQVAKSAGNKYWSNSSPTITHPAPAYNILVVANMDDDDTVDRSDDVRSGSSSVGPTLNNRRKPDITAPGTDIISLNNSWSGSRCSNTDPDCWESRSSRQGCAFSRCTGTSMAAPHVAAAIILMEDGGNHVPMAQKAVLINTADAWSSQDTETTSDDGPVNGSHWDKSYGWGYLDMGEAHFNRGDYFLGTVVPRNDNAVADDYKLYKGWMFLNEKATLVWQKRADYVAGEPPSTSYTLSDLNIRLYDESDGSTVDYDLDGNDNVHQVSADHNMHAVIKVYSWSTAFSGASSEPFALATEENFSEAEPPSFYRNYTRPNYVGPYQTFDVIVRIFNNGDVTAFNNTVTLQNITGISVDGSNSHSLAPILPGPYPDNPQETTYTLTTSGVSEGTYWLPLEFESHCYDEVYTYSTSQGVSIIVETTPPVSSCTSPPYANGAINVNWSASDAQTGVKQTYLYVKRPGDVAFSYAGLASAGTSGTFHYMPTGTDGVYYFAVRSVDQGGNWEALPTSADSSTFYDTQTPVSSLSSPEYDTGGAIPLTFSVRDPLPSSGIEFVDFWYRKDGSAIWTYTGLFSANTSGVVNFTPSTGEGIYHFVSRAKDNAQNLEHLPNGNGDTTIYDLNPPTGSISINNGATRTTALTVTLNLNASDSASGVASMRFSNNGSIWSAWESYSTVKTDWDLSEFGGSSAPGTKTACVQFMDAASWISSTQCDTIEYVLTCPGDLDLDGDVDGEDLVQFSQLYSAHHPDADLNGDALVDQNDVGAFAANYARTGCF